MELFFDLIDVFSLFDKFDDRYTLSADGIPNILLKKLAAPVGTIITYFT